MSANLKIALSHPHGSLFSYHAAKALSEKGWLGSFQTGVTSNSTIARLLSHLSPDSTHRLRNRRYDGIPDESRRSHVFWEAMSRAGQRFKPKGPSSQTSWYDVLFCGHDWQVSRVLDKRLDAVYGYEDGARLTLEAAGRRSLAKVYELPAGYYLGAANEMERAAKNSPGIDVRIKREPNWKRVRKDAELELADVVVVPCEWARESLRFSRLRKQKVVKVPYGTPADEVDARTSRPAGGPFTVLFAGQIGVRKGAPILLEAWRRLALKDARLWMAGGMNLDEKYLKDNGDFNYLGALPRARLLEVMKEVDLFVFPSLAEGFGLVIGEAMAVGVPVLTTTNTGGPELIDDGREGWCVPAHDVDSLTERIQWAYLHRDELYEMGRKARLRAEQWTWADYRRELTNELSRYLPMGTANN